MTLRYMTNDGKVHTVKGVRRAFADTRAGIGNKVLHYETINDERGRGTSLDMADIRHLHPVGGRPEGNHGIPERRLQGLCH